MVCERMVAFGSRFKAKDTKDRILLWSLIGYLLFISPILFILIWE